MINLQETLAFCSLYKRIYELDISSNNTNYFSYAAKKILLKKEKCSTEERKLLIKITFEDKSNFDLLYEKILFMEEKTYLLDMISQDIKLFKAMIYLGCTCKPDNVKRNFSFYQREKIIDIIIENKMVDVADDFIKHFNIVNVCKNKLDILEAYAIIHKLSNIS